MASESPNTADALDGPNKKSRFELFHLPDSLDDAMVQPGSSAAQQQLPADEARRQLGTLQLGPSDDLVPRSASTSAGGARTATAPSDAAAAAQQPAAGAAPGASALVETSAGAAPGPAATGEHLRSGMLSQPREGSLEPAASDPGVCISVDLAAGSSVLEGLAADEGEAEVVSRRVEAGSAAAGGRGGDGGSGGESARGGAVEVFIGGLAPDAAEEEVRAVLEQLGAGEVASVRLQLTRGTAICKGYGFATFADEASAQRAVAAAAAASVPGGPGVRVGGRRIGLHASRRPFRSVLGAAQAACGQAPLHLVHGDRGASMNALLGRLRAHPDRRAAVAAALQVVQRGGAKRAYTSALAAASALTPATATAPLADGGAVAAPSTAAAPATAPATQQAAATASKRQATPAAAPPAGGAAEASTAAAAEAVPTVAASTSAGGLLSRPAANGGEASTAAGAPAAAAAAANRAAESTNAAGGGGGGGGGGGSSVAAGKRLAASATAAAAVGGGRDPSSAAAGPSGSGGGGACGSSGMAQDLAAALAAYPKIHKLLASLKSTRVPKTALVVLHEYAAKMSYEVMYNDTCEGAAGPYTVEARLTSGGSSPALIATATAKARTKKDAKHVAAAACLEQLMEGPRGLTAQDLLPAPKPPQQGGGGPPGRGGRGGNERPGLGYSGAAGGGKKAAVGRGDRGSDRLDRTGGDRGGDRGGNKGGERGAAAAQPFREPMWRAAPMAALPPPPPPPMTHGSHMSNRGGGPYGGSGAGTGPGPMGPMVRATFADGGSGAAGGGVSSFVQPGLASASDVRSHTGRAARGHHGGEMHSSGYGGGGAGFGGYGGSMAAAAGGPGDVGGGGGGGGSMVQLGLARNSEAASALSSRMGAASTGAPYGGMYGRDGHTAASGGSALDPYGSASTSSYDMGAGQKRNYSTAMQAGFGQPQAAAPYGSQVPSSSQSAMMRVRPMQGTHPRPMVPASMLAASSNGAGMGPSANMVGGVGGAGPIQLGQSELFSSQATATAPSGRGVFMGGMGQAAAGTGQMMTSMGQQQQQPLQQQQQQHAMFGHRSQLGAMQQQQQPLQQQQQEAAYGQSTPLLSSYGGSQTQAHGQQQTSMTGGIGSSGLYGMGQTVQLQPITPQQQPIFTGGATTTVPTASSMQSQPASNMYGMAAAQQSMGGSMYGNGNVLQPQQLSMQGGGLFSAASGGTSVHQPQQHQQLPSMPLYGNMVSAQQQQQHSEPQHQQQYGNLAPSVGFQAFGAMRTGGGGLWG